MRTFSISLLEGFIKHLCHLFFTFLKCIMYINMNKDYSILKKEINGFFFVSLSML